MRALDDVPLALDAMTSTQRRTMRALLTSYGQTDVIAKARLANVSRAIGFDIGVVIHGHDRDESGFFREGAHQLCPCIFGAPHERKRYVRLDLASHYACAEALRDGEEIRHLYDA